MRAKNESGFTLVELVVVIVLVGVLAAVAVPRYVGMGAQARIAAVRTAQSAVAIAVNGAMLKCRMVNGCVANGPGTGFPGPSGVVHSMWYGYPTGMTRAGSYFGIKDWVQLDGFTTTEVSYSVTDFTKDGAPDPANCKVRYTELTPLIVATTSGC